MFFDLDTAHDDHCSKLQYCQILYLSLMTVLFSAFFSRLGLTTIRKLEVDPPLDQCELRLSREYYVAIFSCDLLLFYILPLLVAVIGCYKIGQALQKNANIFSFMVTQKRRQSKVMRVSIPTDSLNESVVTTTQTSSASRNYMTAQRHDSSRSSKIQVRDN